jgi:uncharacterized membrane protein YfcA
VGGGGAILALPVLVYVLGERVGAASTTSLVIVAGAAAAGACSQARRGQVCWHVALLFITPAAVGTLLGAIGNHAVAGRVLILGFAPVMLLAAASTWRRAGAHSPGELAACPPAALGRTAVSGLAVGLLTGFFGVGGGFLIVPVLTTWLELDVRRAIGTSLVIIALTAAVGLGSHLLTGASVDGGAAATLGASTVVGAIMGAAWGCHLPRRVLARSFAVVVVTVAALLLVDVLLFAGPPGR